MHKNTKGEVEIIRGAGLKVTDARVAILSQFIKKPIPLSALEIQQSLASTGSDVVTVYRTLTSFEEAGILRKVDLRRDAVYYELADHHHHHIVCTDCGLVEDIEDCDVEILSKKVVASSKKFSAIKDHALEFFGLCQSCVKR